MHWECDVNKKLTTEEIEDALYQIGSAINCLSQEHWSAHQIDELTELWRDTRNYVACQQERIAELEKVLRTLEVMSPLFGISHAHLDRNSQLVGWAECDYCIWESHQQDQQWPPIHKADCPVTIARATLGGSGDE